MNTTHRSLGGFRALPDDLEGRGYRGPAQVPVLPRVVVVQELQQAWHVHVIIVVEVAEPPETHQHRTRLNTSAVAFARGWKHRCRRPGINPGVFDRYRRCLTAGTDRRGPQLRG